MLNAVKIRQKFILLTTASLIGLLVSGCSTLDFVGPDPVEVAVEEVVPVPNDWAEVAPEDLPTTDWVATFDSPQLLDLVSEGMESNPGARRALAQFDASLARLRVSRADLYPTLGTGGAFNRTGNLNESPVETINGQEVFVPNNNRTVYSGNLNSRWEIDLFGRIRSQVEANRKSAEASASDLAALRLSVAGRIAQTWFDVIEAERLIDLSAREIETQERSLRLTERRFDSGLTGSSDVRLARSALANAQALEATRKQNLKFQMRALEILLGRYPDASMTLPDDLPSLPAFEGAAAPQYVLNRRPDILAVEQQIAAGGYSVDAARKALYPSLVFSGSLTEQGLNFGDVTNFQDILYQVVGNLTAPLYQGGRIRANIKLQEANLEAQVATYIETVLQAYQEVENALDAETRLAERETALRVSLDESLRAEERLEERYVEGLASILQLLDAQSRSLNAEGQLIASRAERLQNRVRLHVALGGGDYGNIPLEARVASLPGNQG